MNRKNELFNAKFNLAFVLRVTPKSLEEIKNFIEKLEDIVIVHSQVSGNRLYIKEEGVHDEN